MRPAIEYRDANNFVVWSGQVPGEPNAWRTKDDPCTDDVMQRSLLLGDSWAPAGEHQTYVWCGADWGWAHAKPVVLQDGKCRVWSVSVPTEDYAGIKASIQTAEREMAAELVASNPALDPNRGHKADLQTLADDTVVCPRCKAESMDLDLLAEVGCSGGAE